MLASIDRTEEVGDRSLHNLSWQGEQIPGAWGEKSLHTAKVYRIERVRPGCNLTRPYATAASRTKMDVGFACCPDGPV